METRFIIYCSDNSYKLYLNTENPIYLFDIYNFNIDYDVRNVYFDSIGIIKQDTGNYIIRLSGPGFELKLDSSLVSISYGNPPTEMVEEIAKPEELVKVSKMVARRICV